MGTLIQHRNSLKRLVLFIAASLSILLSLRVVLFHDGWPQNHEYLAWAYRTKAYSIALQNFDVLPVWSSEGVYGMGSAWPLFYHKLFYIVAGSFYSITSSIKLSACLSLYLFGLIAVVGIYKTCSDINLGYWKSVIVAISFPHLNYVTTDWLVRGAFAEYAALCMSTLLIWWCVHLVVKKAFRFSITLILFLIFLSHSVIAYYGVLAIVVSFLIFCTAYPKRLSEVIKRAALASIAFFILVGPISLLMYFVGRYSNLGYLRIYRPVEQYKPFWRYIFDKDYIWGSHFLAYTVQLDISYLLGILLLLSVFGIVFKRQAVDLKKNFWRTSAGHGFFLVTAILSIYLVLQLPVSALFYKYVPGAEFIQFPWRLLAFITILIVVLFAMLASVVGKFYPSISTTIVIIVSVASIGLGMTRSIDYEWFSKASVESPPSFDFFRWREYWPIWSVDDKGTLPINKEYVLRKYARIGPVAISSSGCVIKEIKNNAYLQRSYIIHCQESSVIALPLIYSGIETVLVHRNQEWYRVNHYRTKTDYRVRFSVPSGANTVKVILPTIFRVMMKSKYPHLPDVEREKAFKKTPDNSFNIYGRHSASNDLKVNSGVSLS
ncbi:MAG: hypothetical protein KAV87_05505 [Desulfobacteraceae bacterium]|nr:hypothetical protein [Desulfobacteraceae bacterium]